MNEVVDFASCHIDPAPLQIMEGTPLSNVSPIHIVKYPTLFAIFNRMLPLSLSVQIHNLFSLLSLQVVYVTSLGRLTGVVSLKDLRRVIELVEKGGVPCRSSRAAASPSSLQVVAEEEEDEQPLKSDSTDV